MTNIAVLVDRDSVHPGDDYSSHEVEIEISESMRTSELLQLAKETCPLANISGGKATWFAYAGYWINRKNIAVLPQQWTSPKFLLDESLLASELFEGVEKIITFRYWCQIDPDVIYKALETNSELPDKYGL